MLFLLCWMFYFGIRIREVDCSNKDIIIQTQQFKLQYKNKQIDSLSKIVNSDKIVLFNGKIMYW